MKKITYLLLFFLCSCLCSNEREELVMRLNNLRLNNVLLRNFLMQIPDAKLPYQTVVFDQNSKHYENAKPIPTDLRAILDDNELDSAYRFGVKIITKQHILVTLHYQASAQEKGEMLFTFDENGKAIERLEIAAQLGDSEFIKSEIVQEKEAILIKQQISSTPFSNPTEIVSKVYVIQSDGKIKEK